MVKTKRGLKYVWIVNTSRELIVFKNKVDALLHIYSCFGKENITFQVKINNKHIYNWIGNNEDIYIEKCKIN